MSTCIRAKHYGETEKAYSEDPIVIQMANELPDGFIDEEFLHEDGSPNSKLMGLANSEYANRGGKPHGHIGAIAHAILIIKGLE